MQKKIAVAAWEKAKYPYMDLIIFEQDKHIELAAKLDKKAISTSEAQLEMDKFSIQISAEARKRNTEDTQLRLQAQQVQAEQDAANAAAWMPVMAAGLNMMQPPPPPTNRIICTNNSMASGTMPNPTICQGF